MLESLARGAVALALAASGGSVAFTFDDAQITESSGIVVLPDGDVVTMNDSGDVGRIFTVDAAGHTVGTTYWNPGARDVESLAPDDADHVWVGDTGDNGASRDHIEVARVPVSRRGRLTVAPTIYRLRYPDGAHDAETLLHAPDGRLLIVTKGFLGGTLYAAPTALSATGVNLLKPISSTGAMLPMATDGVFLPGGRRLLVRGYTSATLYAWPSLERLGSMALPGQRQGEGIGVARDGTLWLSSEGVHSEVLHIALSPALRAIVDRTSVSASATPGAGTPTATPPATGSAGERLQAPGDSDGGAGLWPWLGGGAVALALLGYLARRRR